MLSLRKNMVAKIQITYLISVTPPLNCVKKPKYVHRIRDSSQKRGWNGNQGTGTCLNRATIVWLFSYIIRWENWDGRICWD